MIGDLETAYWRSEKVDNVTIYRKVKQGSNRFAGHCTDKGFVTQTVRQIYWIRIAVLATEVT